MRRPEHGPGADPVRGRDQQLDQVWVISRARRWISAASNVTVHG